MCSMPLEKHIKFLHSFNCLLCNTNKRHWDKHSSFNFYLPNWHCYFCPAYNFCSFIWWVYVAYVIAQCSWWPNIKQFIVDIVCNFRKFALNKFYYRYNLFNNTKNPIGKKNSMLNRSTDDTPSDVSKLREMLNEGSKLTIFVVFYSGGKFNSISYKFS